ncbi:DUF3987 domain-containing protein [Nitratidesulfovibrio vulgaris]|uniref:Toprim sub domain protein n=1 Tax=Nitratidesulfovibrio vulgaris (strain DP4) TaxID=391774 RepID=A0A0H3A6N2_NITV4|nr:DUF3987 domain-containing protein [Nitratidesulfovibrio vulgaris]ABM27111.1 Toprim sub domain protein [Nitratidesulfovibrio vulgaris DP4]
MAAPTEADLVAAFTSKLEAAGLLPGEVIADGTMQRCPTVHKPRGKDGAYIARRDMPPNVWWRDWRTGEDGIWFAVAKADWTPADRTRVAEQKAEREALLAAQYEQAAREAQRIWDAAKEADDGHEYLQRKGVRAYGLRLGGDELLVPLRDATGLRTLQGIGPDGFKRLLTGGRKAGCFFAISAKDGSTAGPLLIAEGYATAASLHMATGYETVMAVDCGNMLAVAQALRGMWPGREIVLCADNDCSAKDGSPRENNPGLEAAQAAASSIGGTVALCPAHDGKSADFNDLHLARGLEAVRAVVEKALPPQFPLHAFPPELRDFVTAKADELQVCPETLASGALCTLAAVAQGRFVVEPWPGYQEHVCLYAMVGQDVSERKSAALRECRKPIDRWEAEQRAEAEQRIVRAQSRRKTLERAIDSKRARLANRPPASPEFEAGMRELAELEASLPEIPKAPRLLIDDTTLEALPVRLAAQGERGAILEPEGGLLGTFSGRYSAKGQANIDVLLKAHDGESLRVDRRGTGFSALDCPLLTLCFVAQPAILRELASNEVFIRRGLVARFFLITPPSRVGYRRTGRPPAINTAAEAAYHRLIRRALAYENAEPHVLMLSAGAEATLAAFHATVERGQRPGGELSDMRGFAGKLPGLAARIAGLFHVAEHDRPEATTISEDTMNRAIQTANYLCRATREAYGVASRLAASDARERARDKALDKIRTAGGAMTKRDLARALPTHKAEIPSALEELCAAGVLERRQETPQGKKGGRPTEVFVLAEGASGVLQ